ncbi:MAG: isoprenylcysteine carboxylmethyltransferase family protein [Acidobacteria bacterium]|nr:isoprenylcysteine carboxylmethyltransferase family protein [Acidobacteriota bacterium]
MGKNFGTFAARWRVPMGFALGIAYLVFAQPTVPLLAGGALVALGGLGVRAYAAGYLDKNRSLAMSGPYAYTRNPLYLGSLLIGLGLVIAGGQWLLALVFIFFFVFVYGPVMRREEAGLREQYGQAFEAYAAAVPLFFPHRTSIDTSSEKFQWKLYCRNREYEASLGYIAGVLFLTLKILLR